MAMGRDAEVEDLRYEDGILEGTVMATGMEIQLEANLFGDEAEGVWIIPEVAEGEFFGSRPPQSQDDAAPSETMAVDASEGTSEEMEVDLEGALRRPVPQRSGGKHQHARGGRGSHSLGVVNCS